MKLCGFALIFGLVIGALSMQGCSSPVLSRCPEKAPDDIRQCGKQVDGEFRMCERPANLYRCSDAK